MLRRHCVLFLFKGSKMLNYQTIEETVNLTFSKEF